MVLETQGSLVILSRAKIRFNSILLYNACDALTVRLGYTGAFIEHNKKRIERLN